MFRIAVHGGVGSPEEWKDGTDTALDAARNIAARGGGCLDAVVEATKVLEDDPRFNAGTGSRIRTDGSVQMDASVMTGHGFGGVACIERVRHPVAVARAVMERSPHILLCGRGATEFAWANGFERYDPRTPRSVRIWSDAMERVRTGEMKGRERASARFWREHLYAGDTVGAVCQMDGEFAAALSTGGSGLMLPGRVGDSAGIGWGIFVGGEGAVVATGMGEDIMMRMTAYRTYALLAEEGPRSACAIVLEEFPEDLPVAILAAGVDGIGIARSKGMAYTTFEEG